MPGDIATTNLDIVNGMVENGSEIQWSTDAEASINCAMHDIIAGRVDRLLRGDEYPLGGNRHSAPDLFDRWYETRISHYSTEINKEAEESEHT